MMNNASTRLAAPLLKPKPLLRRFGPVLRRGGRLLARHQLGLAIAGLLLAQLLVVLLYNVLVDQQARVREAWIGAGQPPRQQQRCHLQLDRRTRADCGASGALSQR